MGDTPIPDAWLHPASRVCHQPRQRPHEWSAAWGGAKIVSSLAPSPRRQHLSTPTFTHTCCTATQPATRSMPVLLPALETRRLTSAPCRRRRGAGRCIPRARGGPSVGVRMCVHASQTGGRWCRGTPYLPYPYHFCSRQHETDARMSTPGASASNNTASNHTAILHPATTPPSPALAETWAQARAPVSLSTVHTTTSLLSSPST